ATPFGSSDIAASPACVDGAVEACSIELAQHGSVISCYEGTRRCEGGSFGPCSNGYGFEIDASSSNAATTSTGLRTAAFSSPTDGKNTPCNSYCREFDEKPPQGITAQVDTTAPPVSSWPAGNVHDYPPQWVAVGNQEPCQVGSDCQFNSECTDPALG